MSPVAATATADAADATSGEEVPSLDELDRQLETLRPQLDALRSSPEPDDEVGALAVEINSLAARLAALQEARSAAHGAPEPAPEVAPETAPDRRAGVLAEGVAEGLAEPAAMIWEEQNLLLPSRGFFAEQHYGDPQAKIAIHAYLDLEYEDADEGGARGGVSTFDNHHANLFLRSLLRPNLLAHLEAEWEHSGEEVEIDQAYVAWAVDDALTLTFGRFYTPFGIERFVQWSPTNHLVSRPLPMREIVPGNFYANGIQLSGLTGRLAKHRFSYEAAISDGLGDDAAFNRRGSRQTRDNNSSRAVSGRMSYVFWPILEVGASVHRQRYTTDQDLDLSFFGLDFSGRYRGFELRAEWVSADVERDAIADLEQGGSYAQLAYLFVWDRDALPGLTLIARYDDLDLDEARDSDDRSAVSLGVKVDLTSHFSLKGEMRFFDEPPGALSEDTALFQAVVDF